MRRLAGIAALALLAPLAAAAQTAAPPPGAAGVPATSVPADNVPAGSAVILTIDQDALYHGSAWGRRADADLQDRSKALNAENDRIAAQLEAEDDALTELRKTLPVNDFRVRADAFDRKVQQTRQERDEAARALIEAADRDRNAFFNAALPIFTDVMGERGAVAILDRRSVFLAAQAIDITDAMIARLDSELGAGSSVEPNPDSNDNAPAAPDQGAEAPPQGLAPVDGTAAGAGTTGAGNGGPGNGGAGNAGTGNGATGANGAGSITDRAKPALPQP